MMSRFSRGTAPDPGGPAQAGYSNRVVDMTEGQKTGAADRRLLRRRRRRLAVTWPATREPTLVRFDPALRTALELSAQAEPAADGQEDR